MLFSENVGRIISAKRKSGSPQERQLLRACPGENTTYTATKSHRKDYYTVFLAVMQEEFFLFPHIGHPGARPGIVRERHGVHHAFLTHFNLASSVLKGRKDLPTRTACLPSWMPPQPVVGEEPPDEDQWINRFVYLLLSLRVFPMQKNPKATFCRVVVLDPARQFSFCSAGGEVRSPSAVFFLLH